MERRITIDPITRLEGHGKIEVFLDEAGNVERAYFQVPELRGFEKFCEGRPAEEMPRLTPRICGVCPWAHHMASGKTLDDLFQVDPPPAAKKIREMVYNAFMAEDHLLHFFFLGGPDLLVGPKAPKADRNVLGVIAKFGLETGKKIIATRRELREVEEMIGGKPVHPVCALPGGVSKPISEEERERIVQVAKNAVEFSEFALQLFEDVVLKNDEYVKLITSDAYTHRTYYMGLVDKNNCVNFYDGLIRVVSPKGEEFAKFHVRDYLDYLAEHVEPWTYPKMTYLKGVGWKGLVDGEDSGVLCVAPLARLNAAEGMATPKAQEAYKRMFDFFGEKPVHHTLAMHWARLIETLYAAERMLELAQDPEITDPKVRNLPQATPQEGKGVVEAPRGTLIHHYKADENGILTEVNLIVATQNNMARICMSVEKAAKALIKGGEVDEGLLNMIEMAFRAYDPCHACATHALPGGMPLVVRVYNCEGRLVRELRRDG